MAEIWLRKYKDNGIQQCLKIKVFDNIDWKFASPISPMPLPEESGQENILIKMEGNTHSINLTWLVKNETVNQGISNSTLGGGGALVSKTIFNIVKWMSDANYGFIGRNLDDSYDLLIFDDTSFFGDISGIEVNNMANPSSAAIVSNVAQAEFLDPLEEDGSGNNVVRADWTGLKLFFRGYIRQIGFRTGKDEPATLRGTIEFLEGNNVVSYQGATPNSPQNFRALTASSNTSTTINLKWKAPRHTGNSAISKWMIAYKRVVDEDFTWFMVGDGTGTNINVTGLTTGTEYAFKVVAFNSQGRGKESDVRYFSTT